MSEVKGDSAALSPAELAVQIDASLKSLLVHIGQSLRAKSRFQAMSQMLHEKAASSTLQSKEEVILLQQYHSGRNYSIPGLKALENDCMIYDGLVKQLANWIASAKDALELELMKAKTREETERMEREQKMLQIQQEERERNEKQLAEQKVKAKTQPLQKTEESTTSIVIDDDEDEDDVPLAVRTTTTTTTAYQPQAANAIDLTNDSPVIPQTSQYPPLDSIMTDPTSLLASLSGIQNTADNANSMALDNFDFSQLGLPQMAPDNTNQISELPADDSLDFNMDFLDYNAMAGGDINGASMSDNSNLFGNFDFSALLASNTDTKKE